MSTSQIEVTSLVQALRDPTRVRIVEVLSAGPRRAGELAGEVGVTPPAMSKHLRVLLSAGFVSDCRASDDARARIFRLRQESVAALRAWIDQLEEREDQ